MTREERHIAVLNRMLENMDVYDSIQPTTKRKKAIKAAIKALSQEPCDNATLKDIFCMGCEYREQEPCDDTVSIRKDILKCRVGKIVAYNVEWLKKHWQMEMDIVCGVKPCEDAISREDAIKAECEACDICGNMRYTKCQYFMQGCNEVKCLRDLPSVTHKSGKWIDTNTQDEMIGKVFKCGQCGEDFIKDYNFNFCPNCGAYMVESQESEDEE